MRRLLKKDEVLTIPNLLSLFRFLLIPVIVYLYCEVGNYYAAIGVICLSGLTDIVDGFIARRYNMVSDLGKILDPIADKATQGVIIICLIAKYKLMLALIVIFVLKEIVMVVVGYIVIKKQNEVTGAKWFGKANTVVLYSIMIVLILFPTISDTLADILICVCMVFVIVSFVLYLRDYLKVLVKKH